MHRVAATRGFTLIEVLCAATVFLLGFAGLSATTVASSRHLARASHRERAIMLADSLAQLAQVLPADTLQGVSGPLVTTYNLAGTPLATTNDKTTFYTATTTVTPQATATEQVYSFKVTVVWTESFAASPDRVVVETWVPSP